MQMVLGKSMYVLVIYLEPAGRLIQDSVLNSVLLFRVFTTCLFTVF